MSRHSRHGIRGGLFVMCAVLSIPLVFWTARSEGATFTFTKIADSSSAIPGASWTLAFVNDPVIDGDTVAFVGGGPCFCAFQIGIYASVGGILQKIADSNTAVPSGTGKFGFFGTPAVGGGTVAFRGDGAASQGIYASAGGSLTRIGDTSSPIPGGVGNFVSFGIPLAVDSDGAVVFAGAGSSSQRGIYAGSDGNLITRLNTSTALPDGTGTFRGFASPSADAGDLSFIGLDQAFRDGIYVVVNGSLATVANTDTIVPGSNDTFAFFGASSLAGGSVAFLGFRNPSFDPGIYVAVGGAPQAVVDTSTTVPGGTENFALLGEPSIDNGRVAFIGGDASGHGGLYLSDGGALTPVITGGDVLGGKVVAALSASRGALSGDAIAFRAVFADGSEGIFVAMPDTTVSVPIDIKPGSVPSTINLGTGGTVVVAILSTATFDATTVDPATVTLAGASVALRGRGTPMTSLEDVDGDGLADLVVHVRTDALELSETDTEAILTATTYTGQRIRGTDTVRIVP